MQREVSDVIACISMRSPWQRRSRVVVFVDQLRELLELVLAKWDSLTDAQRAETAQHLIPEVSTALPGCFKPSSPCVRSPGGTDLGPGPG